MWDYLNVRLLYSFCARWKSLYSGFLIRNRPSPAFFLYPKQVRKSGKRSWFRKVGWSEFTFHCQGRRKTEMASERAEREMDRLCHGRTLGWRWGWRRQAWHAVRQSGAFLSPSQFYLSVCVCWPPQNNACPVVVCLNCENCDCFSGSALLVERQMIWSQRWASYHIYPSII